MVFINIIPFICPFSVFHSFSVKEMNCFSFGFGSIAGNAFLFCHGE